MSDLSNSDLQQQLCHIFTAKRVLNAPQDLIDYGQDWSKQYAPKPAFVVFPTSTAEVVELVKFANRHRVPLVPSGGRTGLSGGATATNNEVVVAFDKMNKLSEFNPYDRSVRCGAGVVTEQLQTFAKEQGLYYPVDFASAGSSQIGGNIATNAGGIKVIKYGMTRDWVAGLTVVTGKGEVLELNKGLRKNNTGYDLRQLFIAGEGTLGFITEATMQLTRMPKNLTVLVLGVPEFAAMMQVLHRFQANLDLTAFEFFSHKAMQKVLTHTDLTPPFASESKYYALLEFEALNDDIIELAMSDFEYGMEQGWISDGVMSQSETQAMNLWRLREDISETISHWTPYKNDISVCVSKVPDFLDEIESVVTEAYPDFEIIWFGHIGDGNLHLNILKPEELSTDAFFARCRQVSTWVFEIVEKYQGSISAEHGVGLVKKPYLHYSKTADEIAYLQSIKQLFDPNGIINPNKLIDCNAQA